MSSHGTGWHDLWGHSGPAIDCPACDMRGPWAVGSRRDRYGVLWLNPHGVPSLKATGQWCPAGQRAVEFNGSAWVLAEKQGDPSRKETQATVKADPEKL